MLSGCGVVPVVVSARSGGAGGWRGWWRGGWLAGAGLADVGWSLAAGRAVLERPGGGAGGVGAGGWWRGWRRWRRGSRRRGW